jgi:hypothetical protein
LKIYHGTDQPDYVRVWRGQRSSTFRCFDCNSEFYAEETAGGEMISDDSVVDDEEELRAAEEELKKELDEDGDRRCR